MIDNILEKFGVKYEDLNAAERETYNSWLESLQKGQLTIGKLREYLTSMREAVANDLSNTDNGTKQDLFLKARLRNYMLLEAFLTTPERAQKQLERAISGFATSIGKKGNE